MISFSQLGTFSGTSLLLIFTPGPDIIYVLTRGIAQGKRVALSAAAGFALGNFAHTFFAVIGLSALITSSPLAFSAVRYAGALYLGYLGWGLLKSGASFVPDGGGGSLQCRTVFRQSVLANIMNPKVALFFLAFFPQFLERGRGEVPLQIITLGTVFVILTLFSFGLVAICSGSVGTLLNRRPGVAPRIGRCAGIVLMALALRLALPF
ncbi:LysE family translocator [Geomonas sp. RF6]|uniref:LysE family translocator n=1 Tax=Geomonas sp. RF6 TaxID=2897342 RepID=UPI001E30AD6C|nr:LysE family translocator [Geomonas sp. RF6]UFS71345.1 LysE family translocator [Geomonas sp. RF6]